ncbi:MAG TPA: hypothetical protein VI999_03135 [Thermoplasmata archaeon]|nr:hypothetical protein [Thermoplasmata archaeon]
MQVGCGVYEHSVKGRPYLYFWHYETKGPHRVQIKEYVGPARSVESRAEALRRCDAYFVRMGKELRGLRSSTLAAIRTR